MYAMKNSAVGNFTRVLQFLREFSSQRFEKSIHIEHTWYRMKLRNAIKIRFGATCAHGSRSHDAKTLNAEYLAVENSNRLESPVRTSVI